MRDKDGNTLGVEVGSTREEMRHKVEMIARERERAAEQFRKEKRAERWKEIAMEKEKAEAEKQAEKKKKKEKKQKEKERGRKGNEADAQTKAKDKSRAR